MKRYKSILTTLAVVLTMGSVVALRAQPFEGGILRIKYPTLGNGDIIISVSPDGMAVAVTGGANSVQAFSLSNTTLSFSTMAQTSWGYKPMSFNLRKAENGYVGSYVIGGDCRNNCQRTAEATWDSGQDKITNLGN